MNAPHLVPKTAMNGALCLAMLLGSEGVGASGPILVDVVEPRSASGQIMSISGVCASRRATAVIRKGYRKGEQTGITLSDGVHERPLPSDFLAGLLARNGLAFAAIVCEPRAGVSLRAYGERIHGPDGPQFLSQTATLSSGGRLEVTPLTVYKPGDFDELAK
jgi:hypothetical protein